MARTRLTNTLTYPHQLTPSTYYLILGKKSGAQNSPSPRWHTQWEREYGIYPAKQPRTAAANVTNLQETTLESAIGTQCFIVATPYSLETLLLHSTLQALGKDSFRDSLNFLTICSC